MYIPLVSLTLTQPEADRLNAALGYPEFTRGSIVDVRPTAVTHFDSGDSWETGTRWTTARATRVVTEAVIIVAERALATAAPAAL